MEEVIAKRIDQLSWNTDDKKGKIVAVSQLHKLDKNTHPYFSVTATLFEGSREVAWGCLHEEVLEHLPYLGPVVKVHLADDNGIPMYAVANAQYWAGHSSMSPKSTYSRYEIEVDKNGKEWAPQMLADHLRVGIESARSYRIAADADNHPNEYWVFICHALESMWKMQADEALAIIQNGSK